MVSRGGIILLIVCHGPGKLLDRYTGQTTVQIFGSLPDLRFTGKITHMRLDKFIAATRR